MRAQRGADGPELSRPRPRAHGLAVLLCALAVAPLAGCAGSDGRVADGARDTTPSAATDGAKERETTPGAPVAEGARPVPRREWRSRFFAWMDNVRPAATHVGLVAVDARLRRQLRRSAEERDRFTTSLTALAGCDAWVEELAPPPRAVARSTRLAEHACARYAEAAALLEGERPTAEAFRSAARRLAAAARLLARANTALRRPELDRLPLPVRGGHVGTSRIEPLLTRVARAIRPMRERVPLAVRCWSRSDWPRLRRERKTRPTVIGFVVSHSQTVNLAPRICERLAAAAYAKETGAADDELDTAFAVGVLMHEAAHVYEEWLPKRLAGSEAIAECWGMQHVRPAARMLGLDAEAAGRLAQRYWAEIYPYEHERYRSDACRDGGVLDRRPGSGLWP